MDDELIKASGESCSICELDFPHATPNPAVADENRAGLGWVFVCAHHRTKKKAR